MPLIDDITIGRYKARNSVIHRLDPRAKGLCVLILLVAVFWIDSGAGLGGGIGLALSLMALSGVGLTDFLRNLKAFFWLFLFTFVLHIVFTSSPESFELPFLRWRIGLSGVENGIFYSLRIGLLLAFSYIFMAVTSPLEIADGLEKSLRPLKRLGFPAHEAAMMLSIALRFVPTLLDEARRIRDAQLCRGARLQGSVGQRVKGFSSMLIPLFASALRRADNLALAMEARGYRGGEGRVSFVELRFGLSDLIGLIVTAAAVAVLKAL